MNVAVIWKTVIIQSSDRAPWIPCVQGTSPQQFPCRNRIQPHSGGAWSLQICLKHVWIKIWRRIQIYKLFKSEVRRSLFPVPLPSTILLSCWQSRSLYLMVRKLDLFLKHCYINRCKTVSKLSHLRIFFTDINLSCWPSWFLGTKNFNVHEYCKSPYWRSPSQKNSFHECRSQTF